MPRIVAPAKNWAGSVSLTVELGIVTGAGTDTVLTDTFTRADSAGSIGGVWSGDTTRFGIFDNKAYSTATGPSNVWQDTTVTDHEISVDVAGAINNGQLLIVRFVDALNYIRMTPQPGFSTWAIQKVVAGTITFVGNIGFAGFTGTITLRAVGNQIGARFGTSGAFSTYTVADAILQTGTKAGLRWNTAVHTTSLTYDNATIRFTTPAVSVWDTALWNTALWGPDQTWTDVTDALLSVDTKRGFSRDSSAWATGSATVTLDNADLLFSEDNAAGTYFGQLGAGVAIRVRASVTLSTAVVVALPMFVGTVDDWDEFYPATGSANTVTLGCQDLFEQLASFDGFEQTPSGENELSGQRMHRVLDNAGWTGERDIDQGITALQETTLAANALTEAKLTADSEGGSAWPAADGSFKFRGRYSRLERPGSVTTQVTFTDVAANAGLMYSAPRIKSSRDLQKSMVAYARKGGETQRATDPVARATIGDRQLSRTDLMNVDDPSVLSLAQREVALRRGAERRVDGLVFRPNMQRTPADTDAAWAWLSKMSMWDLARVVRTPLPALTIDRQVFVTGISHSVRGSEWVVGLDFQSATVWQSVSSGRFDVGEWDSAVWTW